MGMMTIKDANNKEFSIDSTKIFDINGDATGNITSIADAKSVPHVQNVVSFVDSNGNELTDEQLKDYQSGKNSVVALDVDIEATHSGKNHNYCVYYEDSMEKDAETFMQPFKKPMLKNHDSWSEPLGRIQQSYFAPSKLAEDRGAINLKVRVTDEDAIAKFLDGRYSTVSIGGSMGTVTCNICGKTILKDNKFKFCGHMRGETYKDEICYWGAKDITYHEVSTVNNPADDFAQVTKVTVITDGDKTNNNKEGDKKDMSDPKKESSDQMSKRDKLISLIDSILEDNKDVQDSADSNNNPEENVEKVSDNQETEVADTNETEAKTEDSVQEEATSTEDEQNTDSIKEIQDKLEEAEKICEDYEKKVKELNDNIENINKELEDANKTIEESTSEIESLKDHCLELAKNNKQLIIDKVLYLEAVAEDKKEERTSELEQMSTKELQGIIDSLENKDDSSSQRELAHVDNPTMANDEDNNNQAVAVDKNGEETHNKNEDEKTINDYVSSIVNIMSSK